MVLWQLLPKIKSKVSEQVQFLSDSCKGMGIDEI